MRALVWAVILLTEQQRWWKGNSTVTFSGCNSTETLPSLYVWFLVHDAEPTKISQGSPSILSGRKTWPLAVGLDGADDLD